MPSISSRRIRFDVTSVGFGMFFDCTKSPIELLSFSPTGVSKEIGSTATRIISRTRSTVRSTCAEISSSVASR